MSETTGGEPARRRSVLTEEQRALVAENQGLVGVHLAHRVPVPKKLRRERERGDLFQEGCLALVRAALTYRADREGTFAPYALFRIRGAIHRALYEYFPTIRVPTQAFKLATEAGHDPGSDVPHVQELLDSVAVKLEARPVVGESVETIRHRIRQRFEQAVLTALAGLRRRKWRRRNPVPIMERLAAERLLIGLENRRTPLREIGHCFGVSHGRTCAYETILLDAVRRHFAEDVQLPLLVSMAGRGEQAFDTPLEPSDQELLARVEVDAFRSRFLGLSRAEQAEAILDMIERSGGPMAEVACNLYRLSASREVTCAVA